MSAKHVVLVDDDEVINLVHREVIKRIVSDVEIDVFKSGPQLIDFLQHYPNKQIDFLFLDIRMPEMDGFEVLSKLQDLSAPALMGAKIYVLSSTLDERDLNRARSNQSVTDFIGKPLSFQTIEQLLGKAS